MKSVVNIVFYVVLFNVIERSIDSLVRGYFLFDNCIETEKGEFVSRCMLLCVPSLYILVLEISRVRVLV